MFGDLLRDSVIYTYISTLVFVMAVCLYHKGLKSPYLITTRLKTNEEAKYFLEKEVSTVMISPIYFGVWRYNRRTSRWLPSVNFSKRFCNRKNILLFGNHVWYK